MAPFTLHYMYNEDFDALKRQDKEHQNKMFK